MGALAFYARARLDPKGVRPLVEALAAARDAASDKDALDVLRGAETDDLAARYAKLLGDKRSEEAAQRGRALLEGQFARRQNVGVQMAIRSAGALGDADEIAALFEALVGDFLAVLK